MRTKRERDWFIIGIVVGLKLPPSIGGLEQRAISHIGGGGERERERERENFTLFVVV